jgi:hypothetical protein
MKDTDQRRSSSSGTDGNRFGHDVDGHWATSNARLQLAFSMRLRAWVGLNW